MRIVSADCYHIYNCSTSALPTMQAGQNKNENEREREREREREKERDRERERVSG